MLLNVEDIIVFTIYQLCNGTMHRQRIVSVFACCLGCHWPVLAGKKLRWPIPVPLTVVSPWQNQGGQWWEFAIIGGRSHVGGVLWGCLRVIYCSTYVGIIFRSWNLNIFDEHLQNHGNYDHYVSAVPNISPWRLCPRLPAPGESWRSQLSPCVISLGVRTDFRIDRGLRDTSRQISFEFLFIKTCPPDKLHNGFGFVIQFRIGIRYVICQGGEFDKKEFKRNLVGSVSYPPVYTIVCLLKSVKVGPLFWDYFWQNCKKNW